MSRRARAAAFGALALVCAVLAASIAGDYRGDVEAQLGELRPVVVARERLAPRRPLGPGDVRELLEVRRVPERFAPVDGLADPLEAVGRRPTTPISEGAYLTAALLRTPEPGGPRRPHVARGREAVEVSVTGAEALAAGAAGGGRSVDVVVTSEPRAGGGDGRTYVAAEGVTVLDLRESGPWRMPVASGRQGPRRGSRPSPPPAPRRCA